MAGNAALIVAAGRGRRFGGPLPKQYRTLGGRPLLRYCLETFAAHEGIDAVCTVIHPDDRALYDEAARGLPKLLAPVAGGEERQDSVRLGLEGLEATAPEHVLIHDGARPFLARATVDATLAQLNTTPGALVAVPVVDTLKRAAEGPVGDTVERTVERAGLWRAQTPQAFRYAAILDAHRAAVGRTLTDDAAVGEAAGLTIGLVPGTEDNFKVTTEDDLARAERMVSAAHETRTGMGFDVHAFGPGDHVWLCGVQVPHEAGLVGHSDADVGLHAITDAVLGAIGAGDIGVHFPPDDPQWKGAASDAFLRHAAGMVAASGGRIVHVDLTLICERPRLRPHHEAMVARVAGILGLAPARVSIKATTTEKLGFTGRGEGIAGQAVATVRLPAGDASRA